MENDCIFYGHLEYFTAVWFLNGHFVNFMSIWYIPPPPFLVRFTTRNLATLL
jgi:hypothetical protein